MVEIKNRSKRMESVNQEQTSELLEAQAHIWNHVFNFINSMSLKCATELGIPDVIHKHSSPITLLELVDALPGVRQIQSQLRVPSHANPPALRLLCIGRNKFIE
ncbi:8-hydroxyquercetin 8-O-methyltransferase [Sesamum alatum]|uniref:8-hydroxyquercetin 8-O-methyltransferase n=1 Tax=Sesamum alatum TaxID=300844 RepID=A0AAE1Y7L6_9LAMI|nr:8-hydroxyquercetin 8-O-methyltransferase [Sesamum alatum]